VVLLFSEYYCVFSSLKDAAFNLFLRVSYQEIYWVPEIIICIELSILGFQRTRTGSSFCLTPQPGVSALPNWLMFLNPRPVFPNTTTLVLCGTQHVGPWALPTAVPAEAGGTSPHLTQTTVDQFGQPTVARRLVRTLSQSNVTSPGLLVLKTSSKSGLPIAWITGPATDPSLTYWVWEVQKKNRQMKTGKVKW